MDFLWHKVTEKEKEEIKKQAKGIMDDFSKKLSKVGKVDEVLIEREEDEREEGGKCIEIDRKIMFDNAPETRGDSVVGEVKKW